MLIRVIFIWECIIINAKISYNMTPHETLEIFSTLWWQTNCMTIGIIILMLFLGQKSNVENKERLAKIIGLVLIFRSIGIHFYLDYLGAWKIESSLPLQLCSLSAILSGLVLFWRKQLLYECLYFWGLSGAFHALLTPEFTNGTQGLLFYEYFLSHGGILLSALYLTWILGMKPRKKSWIKIFLYTQIILIAIGFINYILNANYMYLCIKPIANNPLLLGEWPWYFLGIEIVAIIHFFILYLPFGYRYPFKIFY